ncbi:hypothetical protein [Novosphingobium beihaiensis]|uniref:Uncharacterized protein n=1 Tax=Novosphingobium beihaiensis TaxID=2930389 RepID=A0ABT0BN17_9SPHN|nr:hypothetical protein [Novosphingobium beihaiensis]MCJ2186243.1 hypothetical protein [Novosphingobium beihaiensis]
MNQLEYPYGAMKRLRRRAITQEPSTSINRGRIWSFVNSALGIFLIGTVIVGSASSLWTQRLECRADFRESEETFRKALVEYRYRMNGSSKALSMLASSGANTLDIWRGPKSPFIFSDYKERTLADVTIDLLRSFGELSLVSDLSSFEVREGGLRLHTGNQSSSVGMPLPEIPAELHQDLASAPIKFEHEQRTRSPLGKTVVETWLNRRQNDGLLAALETTVLVRLEPSCDPFSLVRRTFTDDNERYNTQVRELYSSVVRDHQAQMIKILAIEALLSPASNVPDKRSDTPDAGPPTSLTTKMKR